MDLPRINYELNQKPKPELIEEAEEEPAEEAVDEAHTAGISQLDLRMCAGWDISPSDWQPCRHIFSLPDLPDRLE